MSRSKEVDPIIRRIIQKFVFSATRESNFLPSDVLAFEQAPQITKNINGINQTRASANMKGTDVVTSEALSNVKPSSPDWTTWTVWFIVSLIKASIVVILSISFFCSILCRQPYKLLRSIQYCHYMSEYSCILRLTRQNKHNR